MNVYLIIILLIILSGFFFSNNYTEKSLKRYLIFCSSVLSFFAMACSADYGASIGLDTIDYYYRFNSDVNKSFAELWEQFLDRYYYRTNSDYDIGYVLLEWTVGRATNSFYVFKLVVCAILLIPLGKLVYKYSESLIDVCFAYIFFISLFYTGLLVGARQTCALGVCIASFLSLLDKNYKKTILYVLVASTLHMSSLLIVIPLLLSFLPNKTLRIIHGIAILMIPLMMIAANVVIVYMGNFIGVDRYAEYGMGDLMRTGVSYIIISAALSLFCFVSTSSNFLDDDLVKRIYAMVPVFTFFAPLIYSNGSMIRITHYTMIYLAVLIPQVTKRKYSSNANLIIIAMIVALSILTLKDGHLDYSFFWNGSIPY